MKKLFLIICLPLLFLIVAPIAYAHESENSGPISAVLHIDPYDQAIAGRQNPISIINITDKEGKFSKDLCNCVAEVKQHERVIYFQNVFNNGQTSFSYVFPEPGDYEIALIGTPKDSHSFKKFEIEFPVTVTDEATAAKELPYKKFMFLYGHHLADIGLGVVITGVCLILAIVKLLKRLKG